MAPRVATLATCNLNQWAMDFQGNLQRIKQSIQQAKEAGATYRVGPELEVPGYGCEDHFNELDTVDHSYECIAELLSDGYTDGIVCDVGAPFLHRGVLYNCRVIMLNGRVLLIRPKLHMANDGNYRETRYFAAWKHTGVTEEHPLPRELRDATAAAKGSKGPQESCPFGDGVVAFNDALLACETCEELFTPQAPHIVLALSGVEIISNGSGSHHQLRKLDQRLDLIRNATSKAGGVYLYANQQGCDGGRLYFDGCACVAVNGQLVAQGSQFSLTDVEVVTATVDLDAVSTYRAAVSSLREQAAQTRALALVKVDFDLCVPEVTGDLAVSPPLQPKLHVPEEEIGYGPAAWLWDYLRRSGAAGYLLPLSGGADSSSTAAIVGCMCQMVIAAAAAGNQEVRQDALRIGQYGPGESLTDARDLANRMFVSIYMGSENSSTETRKRAAKLAEQVGAYHMELRIDSVVSALLALFSAVCNRTPRYRADGGSNAENLAMQNIQARIRMVLAFLFAQLTPWVRGRSGFLLVLGSANVDECLRGYLTKYDCSSADINPIGGISKGDLRRFLQWGATHLGYSALADVEAAKPTAELEPLREGQEPQTDEVDMGMTYEELGLYGRLRKVARCGPVTMFRHCLQAWRERYPPDVIASKVKDFFRYYAMNRHKATVLTPSYHAENYSPDDNRFDHRQFLYNTKWPWQFACIDALAAEAAAACKAAPAKEAVPNANGIAKPLMVAGPTHGL